MKIGIIGGGAIGLLAAARLSNNHQITLMTRTPIQADEINKKGISVIDEHRNYIYKDVNAIGIVDSENLIRNQDIILLTVKQTALKPLIPFLEDKATSIIFLQNGMDHFNYINGSQIASIYTGVVEHGSIRTNHTTVHHTGNGKIKIGLYKGIEVPGIESLDTEGFPVRLIPDIWPVHIEKLIVNSVINPLTSVLGVRNGELIKNTYYAKLMRSVCREVCDALLIPETEHHTYLEKVFTICERTAGNTSSMLKDLQLGRKTEIEAILGYCIREAEKNNASSHQCKLLYHMVRGLEESGEM